MKINYYCNKLTLNMSGYIKAFLEHASSQGYKSNVLKPIMWIMFILFGLTVVCLYLNQIVFAYIFIILGIIFLGFCGYAYFFCLHNNPDLLRSERFNIEKTALEKVTLTGDSSVGKLKMNETDYVIMQSDNIKGGIIQDLSNENILNNN